MNDLVDHAELYDLAEKLVKGSRTAYVAAWKRAPQEVEGFFGRRATKQDHADIDELFAPGGMDRYDIVDNTVQFWVDEDYRAMVSLGEFVAGIAVACGVEPQPQEVNAVVYYVGELMEGLVTRG